jgi:hypothetical protein
MCPVNACGTAHRSVCRLGKPLTALQYVDDALRIEISVGGADSPATTHLNMCAILSALARHESAIQHAQCALRLLVGASRFSYFSALGWLLVVC